MTAIALMMAGLGAILLVSGVTGTNVTQTFDEILNGTYPANPAKTTTPPTQNQNPTEAAPPEKQPKGLP